MYDFIIEGKVGEKDKTGKIINMRIIIEMIARKSVQLENK